MIPRVLAVAGFFGLIFHEDVRQFITTCFGFLIEALEVLEQSLAGGTSDTKGAVQDVHECCSNSPLENVAIEISRRAMNIDFELTPEAIVGFGSTLEATRL